ncbi:MAG: VWA containing CoxE family protein, partial [Leptolyngbyaceae cyanobacterium CAN_BIN12]|nr:VWA containing CoxE family protein [Leptolyngbyaceae cyanobacterium CAN_BIN12]
PETEFSTLPVRSPFVPAEVEDLPELYSYHPLSRRSMAYGWRYLRRSMATGVADLLDVQATVEQVAKQGFFLAPVYRRREINQAQLLLLVDQGGSMTPFHRFTHDLVETALAPGVFPDGQVQVGYFHNFPTEYLYLDDHLTLPKAMSELLADCDRETSVMILSDAGAARGYRRMERIRKTTEFLVKLKRYSGLISWLNPMPRDRWQGSSAEVIAYLVSMEQMDTEGLGNAIDVVRGQSVVLGNR